jgi:hypothetical protein
MWRIVSSTATPLSTARFVRTESPAPREDKVTSTANAAQRLFRSGRMESK